MRTKLLRVADPKSMNNGIVKVNGRIAILDLLRFLAAFLVMLYHYQPFLSKHTNNGLLEVFKFGYLGVNFFFMLSGFVIMASAQNRTAIKFAILRAARLYPTFICCLLLTIFVLHYFDNQFHPAHEVVLNGLIINDYFSVQNIDGVYWTLQAELKFYGCIFLLILFSRISNYRIWMMFWLLLAASFYFFQLPFFLGWFISPSYSFYFMSGVAAYYLYVDPKNFFPIVFMLAAMVFAVATSRSQIDGFYISPSNSDRLIAATVTIFFFVFFFFLRVIDKYISYTGWLAILGGISYPLYLIHNRAGKLLLEHFSSGMGWWIGLLVTISIVIVVSLCVHVIVEKPVFRLVRKHV
jgi:peptidoglycan/LPS O-acetylase OafA/YrhL